MKTVLSFNNDPALATRGLPVWLIHLRNAIFEGLPTEDHDDFRAELAKRIPVGVDLGPVQHWLAMSRIDRMLETQRKALGANHARGVHDAIQKTIAVLEVCRRAHEAAASGNTCELSSAEAAAEAAAESARAAAESAWWSAEATRWSAASAESAGLSAESARWSAAESAAKLAALAAESARWSAAVESAWAAAESAEAAAEAAAESAWAAAESAEAAAEAAWSAGESEARAAWLKERDALFAALDRAERKARALREESNDE